MRVNILVGGPLEMVPTELIFNVKMKNGLGLTGGL